MTLNSTCQGHSRSNVMMSLDSAYMVSYWHIQQFSPLSSHSHSKCILRSLIIRPKLRKIASAPNDPKMTLNAKRPKVPLICSISTHESQISLRFALRSLVYQIIEVFDFSIGYNYGEFEIFKKKKKSVKNQVLKISKITNVVMWGPLGWKFRTSFKPFGCDM